MGQIALISTNTVEPLLSNPHFRNFQLSNLKPTLSTPFKPVIVDFLLTNLIVTLPSGLDNRDSTVYC